jgi:DNA-binding response OmpR family regulator
MHVLIAESEMAVSRLLGVLMKREGHESQVVEDGTEALEVARSQVPDLVVMDAVLPGLCGRELVQELQAADETAGIPLIVLGTQEELDEFGTNGFATLSKPFALTDLRAAIEHAVESGVATAR